MKIGKVIGSGTTGSITSTVQLPPVEDKIPARSKKIHDIEDLPDAAIIIGCRLV
jgi:hypothetical protein